MHMRKDPVPVSLRLRWSQVTTFPQRLILFFFDLIYQTAQLFIIFFFKPKPPKDESLIEKKSFGRIAIIGAGLTGVSSAAHCIAHNFDVVIFEKSEAVGGVWAHVNSTSGLQINSLIYRFHPAVFWREGFPKRDEILSEITRIWKEYKLEQRTRFDTEVVKVERVEGTGPPPPSPEDAKKGDGKTTYPRSKWLVYTSGNDEPEGPFDAIVATIGTCGEPIRVKFDGMDDFLNAGGRVVHSSELDTLGIDDGENSSDVSSNSKEGPDPFVNADMTQNQPEEGISYADKVKNADEHEQDGDKEGNEKASNGVQSGKQKQDGPLNVKGKTVVIIGSGASGVEAAEWAVEKGAGKVCLLARDDKWIIPQNVVFDTLLACQPFGREMPLSFLIEWFLRTFHYRDLADSVAPKDRGLFEGTPIVNNDFLTHIREGKVKYVRGSSEKLTSSGVVAKLHIGEDVHKEYQADLVVLATGFKRPSDDFLPEELFPPAYDRPNLYLQNFCTEDWSVLLTNASYMNAIGTVGHFHIGIYMRILLTFLLDVNARPKADDMKLWVDVLRFVKRGAKGGALGFFTYAELTFWLLSFHLFRPSRVKWMLFIMQGWGVTPSEAGRFKVED